MVELNRLPPLGRVTAFALLAKLSLVPFLFIHTAMASNARSRRFSVGRVLVTFSALGLNVLSGQREPGFIVIKLGFFPI